jgi:hypothetical protein
VHAVQLAAVVGGAHAPVDPPLLELDDPEPELLLEWPELEPEPLPELDPENPELEPEALPELEPEALPELEPEAPPELDPEEDELPLLLELDDEDDDEEPLDEELPDELQPEPVQPPDELPCCCELPSPWASPPASSPPPVLGL